MKLMTIREPFASRLLLPDDDRLALRYLPLPFQDVHRGRVLIRTSHARYTIHPHESIPGFDLHGLNLASFRFGEVIGLADLVDWCPTDDLTLRHPHLGKPNAFVTRPFCAVFENPHRLIPSVRFGGSEGELVDVNPDEIGAALLNAYVEAL